jgi:hypothetical protein
VGKGLFEGEKTLVATEEGGEEAVVVGGVDVKLLTETLDADSELRSEWTDAARGAEEVLGHGSLGDHRRDANVEATVKVFEGAGGRRCG